MHKAGLSPGQDTEAFPSGELPYPQFPVGIIINPWDQHFMKYDWDMGRSTLIWQVII